MYVASLFHSFHFHFSYLLHYTRSKTKEDRADPHLLPHDDRQGSHRHHSHRRARGWSRKYDNDDCICDLISFRLLPSTLVSPLCSWIPSFFRHTTVLHFTSLSALRMTTLHPRIVSIHFRPRRPGACTHSPVHTHPPPPLPYAHAHVLFTDAK